MSVTLNFPLLTLMLGVPFTIIQKILTLTIDRQVKAYGFLPGDLNLVKSCFNSNDKITTFVKMQWLSFYTGGNIGWVRDTINHSEQRTKVHL